MYETFISIINSPGFGVVLGAAISIFTTTVTNRYTLKSKRVEKQLEVSYDIKLSQLNTLVDIQAAVQKLGRASVQCCNSLLNDGLRAENGNRLVDPAIDEERRLLGVDVILLNSRVISPDIRMKVKETASWGLWSNDAAEIQRYMHSEADKTNNAMEVIGAEIREIQDSLIEKYPKEKR